MQHCITKYQLRNADNQAYSLIDLKNLIDDLKIQVKIVSHKLGKVVVSYPPTFSPDLLIVYGYEVASTNEKSKFGHVDLLYRVNQFLKETSVLCLFCDYPLLKKYPNKAHLKMCSVECCSGSKDLVCACVSRKCHPLT